VDWKSAFAMVYPKAIYMVEGEPFEVQELRYREDEEKVAYVKRVHVDYFTDAISAKGVWVLQRFTRRESPGWGSEQGEVLVAEKVVGFKKIKMGTLENVGSGEVELPQQEMQTDGAWLTVAALLTDSRRTAIAGRLRALTRLRRWRPLLLRHPRHRRMARRRRPSAEGQVVTRETCPELVRDECTPTVYLRQPASGSPSVSSRSCPSCSREASRRSRAARVLQAVPPAWAP
jgi:hypothetical protein